MRAKGCWTRILPCRAKKIRRWLGPHLCRCTGYTKIVDAIELAGKVRRGGKFPELDQSGRVARP